MEVVTLQIAGRPWTLNDERPWAYPKVAKQVRDWRSSAETEAKLHRLPRIFVPVGIVGTPHLVAKGRPQDAGGCYPAIKAAVDGLVDAGVLEEDGPRHVRWVTCRAPVWQRKKDSYDFLVIQLIPLEDEEDDAWLESKEFSVTDNAESAEGTFSFGEPAAPKAGQLPDEDYYRDDFYEETP